MAISNNMRRLLLGEPFKFHFMVGGGRRYPLSVPLNLTPIDPKFLRINGGDDGARTRDLCRDRIPKRRNPLETGVADGYLSALWTPWERLLNPY